MQSDVVVRNIRSCDDEQLMNEGAAIHVAFIAVVPDDMGLVIINIASRIPSAELPSASPSAA